MDNLLKGMLLGIFELPSYDDPKMVMKKIITGDIRKLAGARMGKWEFSANRMEIDALWTAETNGKTEISKIQWGLEKSGRRLAWREYFCDTFRPDSPVPSRCEWSPAEFPKMTLYKV